MSTELLTALIAAVVSIIAASITLWIGKKKLRVEEERLIYEKKRIQAELNESIEQTKISRIELNKLKAETDKLILETDYLRNRRFEAEREEIRNLLIFFDRAVYHSPVQSEDPIEMFKAIRQTRILLQTSGAGLVRDKEIAEKFHEIKHLLWNTENEVIRKYPLILKYSDEIDDKHDQFELRKKAREYFGNSYYEPVGMMMDIRWKIDQNLNYIRMKFDDLNRKIT